MMLTEHEGGPTLYQHEKAEIGKINAPLGKRFVILLPDPQHRQRPYFITLNLCCIILAPSLGTFVR
jgi:hypothetical protein